MKFDSGQITVVIAIAAIISPVIVAVVNDVFNYKLKKQEFELNTLKLEQKKEVQQHKINIELQTKMRKLVADFITITNQCYQHVQVENYGQLAKANVGLA